MAKLSLLLTELLYFLIIKSSLSTTEDPMFDHDERQPLYVIASGPYPDTLDGGWAGGIPLVAAVRLAFSHINNNTSILPGYRLEALDDDSGCRVPSKALLSFFRNEFYSGKNVVGIIGPACSESTLLMAPLLARRSVSIIQIAPSATSPAIQVQNQNTTFTMITPLDMASGFISTFKQNKWRKLTIVYDARRLFYTALHNEVTRRVAEDDTISISSSLIILDSKNEQFFPIEGLKSSTSRVILLLMESSSARKFLCIAKENGFYYPRYQWVLLEKSLGDFTQSQMFNYSDEMYNCSIETIATAANGTIILQYQLRQDNETIVSPNNITFNTYREQLDEEFQRHLKEERVQEALNATSELYEMSQLVPKNNWENLYYDAAWALGLALDGAGRRGLNLSEYKYGQPNNTQILLDSLSKVDFAGAVGPVSFTPNRTVQSQVIVYQLRGDNKGGLSATNVALFAENELQFINNESKFLPPISDTFGEVEIRVHLSLGIIVIVMTIILTVLTASLQVAFIKWSKKKCVRATSPEISHLIFSGCYLFSVASVLFTIQQTIEFNTSTRSIVYSVLCNVITWCLLLGFSLIFGTVFVKVWRVFKLFRHFRNERPGLLLSDRSLVIAVICFIFVDTLICVVWSAYDPWILLVSRGPIQDVSEADPVATVHLTCTCRFDIYWILAVAAYKGGIALLLVVFSVLNRKIQRKNFSHTKKVNILVYSLTVLGGAGFPLYFLLTDTSIYATFFIFSTILLATVAMCCLMLFLPPIWPALKLSPVGTEVNTYISSFERRPSIRDWRRSSAASIVLTSK